MSKKISELTAAGTLDGSELIEAVQGGASVQTTAQAIADLGGGGNTLYSADDTIADAARVVTLPSGGTLTFGLDGSNFLQVGEDGGFYSSIYIGGTAVTQVLSNGLRVTGIGQFSGAVTGLALVSAHADSFTAAGASGTHYTDEASIGQVTATIPAGLPVGHTFTFSVVTTSFLIDFVNTASESVLFYDLLTPGAGSTTQGLLSAVGMSATFVKINTMTWLCTAHTGLVNGD